MERERRNEIAISIEASRLNHPRDICVHIDVFSEEGATVEGVEGLLRSLRLLCPRTLHRNYSTVY